MTTSTLTLRRDQVSQLRRGDRIIAIDGRALPGEFTVTGRLAEVRSGGAVAVPMQSHEYNEWHVWVDGEPAPDAPGETFTDMAPYMVALYRQATR